MRRLHLYSVKALRFILFPLALLYWAITAIRNAFYNLGIFKTSKFSLPIISVGNLSMGGTGKTPTTEYLVRLLKNETHLATLSRGYGRKEYGFKIADNESTALSIGDEPLQYFHKFGNEIDVVVESNRVTGVMDLCRERPETNCVLLDDAYQHRAIHKGINILITSYDKPFYKDWIVPVGELRESKLGKKRADIVIVSKCPGFEKLDKTDISSRLNLEDRQDLFFSKIVYGNLTSLNKQESLAKLESRNVILVTGIESSNQLLNYLEKENKILHHFKFADHYKFKESDLKGVHDLFDKFANENPVIITTEKDAMRLLDKQFTALLSDKPWFYQSIKIELDREDEFNKIILDYVKENN